MLAKYPHVRTEEETLRRVLAGASIARYGDGEFKHCADKRNVSQEFHPRLSQRLREILGESGPCMVGIPNLNKDALERMTPEKAAFWEKHRSAAEFLETRPYSSAFITRPDSAPWINTAAYWTAVESLWRNKDITLVRGSGKGLTCEDLAGAGCVTEIMGTRQSAFKGYDQILARVVGGRPKRVLICLGPTATVLAVDLAAQGIHAIDLGHIALFIRKWRRGEPMTLSKDDKSQDKPQPAEVV